MKHLFAMILMCLSLGSFAQIGPKGEPVYLEADTLKGADTIYIQLPKLTGYYSLSWEIYFEQIGGTSDGIGLLQSANDSIYHTVVSVDGSVTATPNDTITIADKVGYQYWLYGTPSDNFRFQLIGTVGDTTRIISNYIRK